MPVANSISCIAKIASAANLSEKTKRYATAILKKAEQELLAGKDPMRIGKIGIILGKYCD